MKYTVNKGMIHFSEKLNKKDAVRINYTRDVDENIATNYPIATTTGNKTKSLLLPENIVKIERVEIKRKRFFGLLSTPWIKLDNYK